MSSVKKRVIDIPSGSKGRPPPPPPPIGQHPCQPPSTPSTPGGLSAIGTAQRLPSCQIEPNIPEAIATFRSFPKEPVALPNLSPSNLLATGPGDTGARPPAPSLNSQSQRGGQRAAVSMPPTPGPQLEALHGQPPRPPNVPMPSAPELQYSQPESLAFFQPTDTMTSVTAYTTPNTRLGYRSDVTQVTQDSGHPGSQVLLPVPPTTGQTTESTALTGTGSPLPKASFPAAKPHICHLCNKECESISAFGTHTADQRPHARIPCPDCNETSKTAQTLDRHVRAHQRVLPRHYCSIPDCEWSEKGFLKRSDLDYHTVSKHRGMEKVRHYVPKS
jgi:hypothetical protein